MDADERARLRALIKDAALPWYAEHRGIVDDRGGTIVADLVEAGAAWGYVEPQGVIVGAVNALPATLDALDAADRAAELAAGTIAALRDQLAEAVQDRDAARRAGAEAMREAILHGGHGMMLSSYQQGRIATLPPPGEVPRG